jgi:hypothetical protein
MESGDRPIRARETEEEMMPELKDRQWRAVCFLLSHGYTGNVGIAPPERQIMADHLEVRPQQAYRILSQLAERRMVKRHRLGKEVHYALNLDWRLP